MPGRIMSPSRGFIPPPYNHRASNRPLSPQPRGRPVSPGLHDIYQNRPVSPALYSGRPTSPAHYRGRAPTELYRNLPRNGYLPLPPGPHRGNQGDRSRHNNRMRQRQYTEQVGQIDFGDEESIPNDAHDLMDRLYSNGGLRDNARRQPRRGRSEERLIDNDFSNLRRPRHFSPSPNRARDYSPRPHRAFPAGRDRGRERFILERGLSPRRGRERVHSPRREMSPRRHHNSHQNVIEDLDNGIYGPPVPVTNPNTPAANHKKRRQRDRRNAFSPPPPRHAHSVPLLGPEHFRPTSPPPRLLHHGQIGPQHGLIRHPPHAFIAPSHFVPQPLNRAPPVLSPPGGYGWPQGPPLGPRGPIIGYPFPPGVMANPPRPW